MASPNIKAVTEGRVAGKMAYEVIERDPKIHIDDNKAKILTDITGKIEFKDVTFSYP
jgi:ABC-type multidrug transport system fused ATPase/permease subunit